MKVWKYVVIFLGMTMFLTLAGIKSGVEPLFDALGIFFTEGVGFTTLRLSASGIFDFFFNTSTGIFTVIAAVTSTVIAGLFTRAKPENIILLPFITTVLVLFISTMVGVIQYSIGLGQAWVSAIITIFLVPLTIGFITSLGEFFRGTD